MEKLTILILTSDPNSGSTKKLHEAIVKRGHDVSIHEPTDFYLLVSESSGNDRVYLKSKEERLFAKSFDRVIVRIAGSMYGRNVLFHLSENLNKFCTSKVNGISICSDKFLTSQVLSKNRIKTIKSILSTRARQQNFGFLMGLLGSKFPAVLKILSGSQGTGITLLESEEAAGTAFESISHFGGPVILQRFINTKNEQDKSSDIRAFIVDGEVVVAMKRYSKAKQFRANYSISAEGEKIELTDEQKEIALNAAAACKSLGICGVDLIQDQDGENYVVECNSNPGLKIQEVTGVNVVDKIIDFVERGKLSKVTMDRYDKVRASALIVDSQIAHQKRRAESDLADSNIHSYSDVERRIRERNNKKLWGIKPTS